MVCPMSSQKINKQKTLWPKIAITNFEMYLISNTGAPNKHNIKNQFK